MKKLLLTLGLIMTFPAAGSVLYKCPKSDGGVEYIQKRSSSACTPVKPAPPPPSRPYRPLLEDASAPSVPASRQGHQGANQFQVPPYDPSSGLPPLPGQLPPPMRLPPPEANPSGLPPLPPGFTPGS